MNQCSVVTFVTPDQYQLNGLWFGPQEAKRGYIVVHGLGSSAFAQHDTLSSLVDDDTAVLFFNNRGHDRVGGVRKLLPEIAKEYETQSIGAAHEVFTDCVDDIQGAVNFFRSADVNDIYLIGHSTGCQKSIYYLSQTAADIRGVVLLCPVSDYAAAVAFEDPALLARSVSYAQKLVADGSPHALLPPEVSSSLLDAQRYLSLNTPDSVENIFSYNQEDKTPTALQKVTVPILAVLAEKDEHADRPAKAIAKWFNEQTRADLQTEVIKDALHSLSGHSEEITAVIRSWGSRLTA